MEWLEALLRADVPGVAQVVYHSIVLQYLSDEGRLLAQAGYHGEIVHWLVN